MINQNFMEIFISLDEKSAKFKPEIMTEYWYFAIILRRIQDYVHYYTSIDHLVNTGLLAFSLMHFCTSSSTKS